jgi:hypothetical protein
MAKISEILHVPDSLLKSAFEKIFAVIDNMHRFPTMATFPIKVTKRRSEEGAYRYRIRPAKPMLIEISFFAEHPELTLTHEIGHLLDHMALNPIKRGFGSDHDPFFEPLLHSWAGSKNVQALRRAQNNGKYESSLARRNMAYQLTPRELWARTYVQWLAVRSRDGLLSSQLAARRTAGSFFAGQRLSFQWEEDDFLSIIFDVDELMKKAGLL